MSFNHDDDNSITLNKHKRSDKKVFLHIRSYDDGTGELEKF